MALAAAGQKKALEKDGVFDICTGEDYNETDEEIDLLGCRISRCMVTKGFCVINASIKKDALTEILDEVSKLEDKFQRPGAEIVNGLLGPEGSARIYQLDVRSATAETDTDSIIDMMDGQMFELGLQIYPWTQEFLGFETSARSRGVIHESGQPDGAAPPMSGPDAIQWLNVFDWHRIMCIFFVGPGNGTLEMQPFDGEAEIYRLETQPGMWIMLRADMLWHRFTAPQKTYAMSCFYMQNAAEGPARRLVPNFPRTPVAKDLEDAMMAGMKYLKETTENEDDLEELASRDLQLVTNHLYQKGMLVAVRGAAGRFPASCHEVEFYRCNLALGVDSGERIPYMRWNHDHHYESGDPAECARVDRTYAEHGNFLDELDLFDNKFFGVSIVESKGMDPHQRQALEVAYETMFSAGYTKKTLMRSHIGTFMGGLSGVCPEWGLVPKDDVGGALASTSGSPAITSNRLSYVFGMNGPNFLMDTGESASMMAFACACDSVQVSKPQHAQALVMGADLILAPYYLKVAAWSGALSRRGRCLSFDCTADGYIRGEGVAGTLCNPLLHEVDGQLVLDENPKPLGAISGVGACNSGRVAKLGAPSSAMDQELIASTLRKAEIAALDVDWCEANGQAGILHDAVEITALSKMYRGRGGEEMLGFTCNKPGNGHGMTAAGIISVMKLLVSMTWGTVYPTQHLLRVNPHMMLDDLPVLFATESYANRMNSCFCTATAKGIGGSNAHMIMWGSIDPKRFGERVFTMRGRDEVVYWPGGGGELSDEARPMKAYTIIGSWTSWSNPEVMQNEGKGVYGYTVTLGSHAVESFQISLDSNPDKILHPDTWDSFRDVSVLGPDTEDEAFGKYWTIDGRTRLFSTGEEWGPGSQVVEVPSEDPARPGDQFRIRLMVNGKYRLVTWEKLQDEKGLPILPAAPASKYFVIASWKSWTSEEMVAHPSISGLYHLDVHLERDGGHFQIMHNNDWRQMIYPMHQYATGESCNPVAGPDDQGHGYSWFLNGKAGDVIRVEFQRAYVGGTINMHVGWRRLRKEPLQQDQLALRDRMQYYIVGSWDRWSRRHLMTWDGDSYAYMVDIGPKGKETFQVLADGDWNRTLYPSQTDAGSGSAVFKTGPNEYGWDLNWTIGIAETDKARFGDQFKVRMTMRNDHPCTVEWKKNLS